METNGQLKTFGDYPEFLFRHFSEKEWAEKFIEEGSIRFTRLEVFAEHEDEIRRDDSEGVGRISYTDEVTTLSVNRNTFEVVGERTAQGTMQLSCSFLNIVHVLCFSCPPKNSLELLPNKFGRYVVKINDPSRLGQEITDYLCVHNRIAAPVECVKVQYNHRQLFNEIPPISEIPKLSFANKPNHYRDEYEYRFVLILGIFQPINVQEDKCYDIHLNKKLDYAELLILDG